MDTVPGTAYKIAQGPGAFSYSIDSLFLSYFARAKGRVLDLGCGPGILYFRSLNPDLKSYTGLDINPQALDYFRESLAYNGLGREVRLEEKSLEDFHEPGAYETVLCNPPYYQNYLRTENSEKNQAKHEGDLGLRDFILKGAQSLRPLGSLYLVLPADRLVDAMVFCRQGGAEPKRLQFLSKKSQGQAHWFCLEARKNAKPHLRVDPDLNLQDHRDLIYSGPRNL